MVRKLIILVMVVIITACGEDTETTVTVQDQEGNITNITNREKLPEKQVESTNTMVGHPLAKYNSPEDERIMKYFPIMVGYCGEKHTKERCDMGVKLFMERAKQIGRNIEEKYVRNPAFWRFQLDVIDSAKGKIKTMLKLPMNETYVVQAEFGKEQQKRFDAFKEGSY
jgi:hypothetical protein